jgi:hypothetical protein
MTTLTDNLLARLLATIAGCDAIIRDPAHATEARERAEQIKRVLITARWAAFQLAEIPLPPPPEPEPEPPL